MDVKNDSIYFRISINKKAELSYIAERENRTISNLLETLIDEKISEWKFRMGEEEFNKEVKYLKTEENIHEETDGDKLRKILKEKNIPLTQFKEDMKLKEYPFKKIFYRKGKINEDLARKIRLTYGVDFKTTEK